MRKSYNQGLKRTVFSNIHETQPNPYRTYYTFINIEGKDYYFEYTGKTRTEAEIYFEEEARLHNGKFATLYAHKK